MDSNTVKPSTTVKKDHRGAGGCHGLQPLLRFFMRRGYSVDYISNKAFHSEAIANLTA